MTLAASPVALSNAVFFGVCVLLVLLLAAVLARLTTHLLALGLRAVKSAEPELTPAGLARRVRPVIALLASAASIALIAAAIVLSMYEVAAAPHVWAWTRAWLLHDPEAALWRAGQLLGLVLAAALLHRLLRAVVGLLITALQRSPTFAQHGHQLATLLRRLQVSLRWGVVFAALLIAADLRALPESVRDPLTALTYISLGVLIARTLVTVADLGVDVMFQLIRAFEGRKTPLRYLGRLEHLAGVTKRTLEYFCFIGAATWVLHQLRPDTWLADTGLVAIRLIALVYVGRVLIAVVELVLRELLVTDRSEAESQQRLTLLPVARSVLRYAVYFCISVMALQELGVDSSPILAGAGLLGLAVGLGAQTLVGDIVSGFFILFEGMFLVGDRVRIGDTIGEVEEIGVRVLKIRDEFGVLHCIPNGEVRSVANHTHIFVNAVVEFSVPYAVDMPALIANLQAHLAGLRPDQPDLLDAPALVVQELREANVLLRCLARVKPGRDDAVGELLRGELLTALTAAGVAPQTCHIVELRHPEAAPRSPSGQGPAGQARGLAGG